MKPEKKIFLEKKDDIEFVLQTISGTPAEVVILNVPRDSVLGKAINNFHVLKNKAAVLNKEVFIESLDEKILEMASVAGLNCKNPLFKRSEKFISDIVPKSRTLHNAKEERKARVTQESESEEVLWKAPPPEKRPDLPKIFFEPKKEPAPKIISFAEGKSASPRSRRRMLIAAAVLILAVPGGFILANNVFSKARISITLKQIEIPFNESVKAAVSAKDVSISPKITLPALLITAKKNLSVRFPANGKENVERKAKATLIVSNAYSSEPQALVQNTRFLSPEGKIFRLDAKVTIPGAKIVNNKIEPSMISVSVTADKPGEEYNVPASRGWRIPGFKGTPRYDGFYAEAPYPASGGFSGEMSVPTEDDKAKAKAEVLAKLESALENEVKILVSDKFKVFPEAREFKVTAENLEDADAEGNFGFMAAGELKYLVFDEVMLKDALKDKATASFEEKNLVFRDFRADYGTSTSDFAVGEISFSISGAMTLVSDIEIGKLQADILGASENKLKQTIYFLPGLEKANVSLWPFWVTKVPRDPDRVKITVD
ncbi:MAG TPA: hypothetical protein VNK70_00420 [Candidatus Paceibacterota bacterium]|nr:hypothetical protein [Candidatus Paceibacterota bacterium]